MAFPYHQKAEQAYYVRGKQAQKPSGIEKVASPPTEQLFQFVHKISALGLPKAVFALQISQ